MELAAAGLEEAPEGADLEVAVASAAALAEAALAADRITTDIITTITDTITTDGFSDRDTITEADSSADL